MLTITRTFTLYLLTRWGFAEVEPDPDSPAWAKRMAAHLSKRA